MSSGAKIIDAVSEPVNGSTPAAAPASSCGIQSVPLKIDASQMQQMLQGLVSKQMQGGPAGGVVQTDTAVERVNPSTYIKAISEDMERLYARFDKLKKLAVELHGRQLDAPLPDTVRLKNISINFSLIKDGKEEEHTAEVQSVTSVGDITGLLSTEFGLIILSLTEKSKQLEDLAHKTGERCSSALKEWENNNKDKKIVRPEDSDGVSVATDESKAADGPVTLEAS